MALLLLEPLLFFSYYWLSLFFAEERLYAIVAKRPSALRDSWFAAREFLPVHVVAVVLFAVALPRSAAAMRAACFRSANCARRLRFDAWGWYDDNDGQWRRQGRRGRCLGARRREKLVPRRASRSLVRF